MEFSFESFVYGSFDYDAVTETHSCIWLREEKWILAVEEFQSLILIN